MGALCAPHQAQNSKKPRQNRVNLLSNNPLQETKVLSQSDETWFTHDYMSFFMTGFDTSKTLKTIQACFCSQLQV